MPDKRQHRGPHPQDQVLVDTRHWGSLQQATADLSWLLTRNYSLTASVKLVGDRYSLRQRQRLAVQRSACSDQSLRRRSMQHVSSADVVRQPLAIDGFNLLMTIEAALGHGIIIIGRDGCYRDMASVHGSFRIVQETLPALSLIDTALEHLQPSSVYWLFDAPVSNSGRVAARLRSMAEDRGRNWDVELVHDPDQLLRKSQAVVVSADSVILDACERWTNLGTRIIDEQIDEVRFVPMTAKGHTEYTLSK